MNQKSIYPLSIITINYNNYEGLKKTVNSVFNQSFTDLEYIVVDGDSNDGSDEFLKTVDAVNFKYISEPDSGIYNAMNKGIAMATGKYLLFLNSGDYLENDNVLNNIKHNLEANFSILSGNIIFEEDKGNRLREHPEKITFSYLVGNAISHPSTFINSNLFKKHGNYDERYKIVSDWAFFLKILGLNNETYIKLSETISVFDTRGISSLDENLEQVYKEREEVLRSYFPRIFNNDEDTYIFNKFISSNKRFKYLRIIDKYPFIRKFATLKLSALVWLTKLFPNRK
jgi:glycosyltransferase involved in cell wall biosynthesis